MEQIAGVTHLNPDYTTRIFRSKTGMTVRGYLIKKADGTGQDPFADYGAFCQ